MDQRLKHALEKLKIIDRDTQLARLQTLPTAETFCEIQEGQATHKKPEYITTNSSRNKAIAIIFSLRAGNP